MSASQTAPYVPVDRLARLPKLGIGLSFQSLLRPFVEQHADAFDFLEVIPDTMWVKSVQGDQTQYNEHPEVLAFLASVRRHKPIIAHSIGLSIGSAEYFPQAHLAQIERWRERYGFPWHSDHLSFNQIEQESGHTMDVGFAMPVPYDEDTLAMLIERVELIQQRIPVPFVLENNVYYFNIPEQDMGEAAFLNRLSAATGCGLLLDLHNVYTNGLNHGFDPLAFIDELDLTRVVEIHIGGGMLQDGFYLDAHSGPCPDQVWTLLEQTLGRAPHVCGVVFEVFNTHFPAMGAERLREELEHARAIWARFH